jgi:hypothetical protein
MRPRKIAWIVKYTKARADLNSLVGRWGTKINLTDDNFVAIVRASVLPCDPQIEWSQPGTFPTNVQLVDKILGQGKNGTA